VAQAPPNVEKRLLRISEVARLLGVSRAAVLELVASGRLRSIRFGEQGWHHIPMEDVERLVAGEGKTP